MQDGTSKMSKSAESDASRINLLDPPDVLANKIKRAKTDGEQHLILSAVQQLPQLDAWSTATACVCGVVPLYALGTACICLPCPIKA